jgi:hypothetical protein
MERAEPDQVAALGGERHAARADDGRKVGLAFDAFDFLFG